MIGNAIALLGLLAVAVPVIIHLLGRHQSRVQRFPTLRFLAPSRLAPTRRKRISDWPLLLVRICIVAAAAIALSQPYFDRSGRSTKSFVGSAVNRAIIVDTSASMRRSAGAATSALDSARRHAASLQGGAGVSTVIESDDPRAEIPGAVAWLTTRPGSRELVLISDFQPATIDAGAITAVPSDIGIELVSIPTVGAVVSTQVNEKPVVIAAPAEMAAVEASWRAIGETVPRDSVGRVAIIYRGDSLPAVATRATTIDERWMGALVANIERDPTLRAAASIATPVDAPARSLDALAQTDAHRPVVVAGKDRDRLLLFLLDDAASLTSVALNQALMRSLSPSVRGAELDTGRIDNATLAQWTRVATPVGGDDANPSDGRWFWLLALILLGIESMMRSRRREANDVAPLRGATVEERAA